MIKKPGRKPSRLEQIILTDILKSRMDSRICTIVIHHITEDSPDRLQLEVEKRYEKYRTFERIVL